MDLLESTFFGCDSVFDAFPEIRPEHLPTGEDEIFFSIPSGPQKDISSTTCVVCDVNIHESYQPSIHNGYFDHSPICEGCIQRSYDPPSPCDSHASSGSEVDHPSSSQPSDKLLSSKEENAAQASFTDKPICDDGSQSSAGSSSSFVECALSLSSGANGTVQASPGEPLSRWGGNCTQKASSDNQRSLGLQDTVIHNPEGDSHHPYNEVIDHGRDELQLPSRAASDEIKSDYGEHLRYTEALYQSPENDVVVSSRKRPTPSGEGNNRRKRKLNTCAAVIQTVSIPGANGTEYKWNHRKECWEVSEPTLKGRVEIGGYELGQKIVGGRIQIRTNGFDIPIWLHWEKRSGSFVGHNINMRRRGITLKDMKDMIQSGGRGKCTYLTRDIR